MNDVPIPASILKENAVDRLASTANDAVDATKDAANSALDRVSVKVESVRRTLSPALNNATAPLDAVLAYTRDEPIKALAGAAVVGAVLWALIRPARTVRHRRVV